jgi:peroxiredoxin/ribosomal protein S18 acetylase RimI-like enzyme
MNSGFVLPNVGPGPDPLTFADLGADFAVLLLHRDFYCSECRQQVRRVKKRYDEFEARDAEVLSVLPEDRETAAEWQKQYHLPFPVIADADTELGDHFEQPTRFGLLGRLHDVIGRMPAVVVLDLRWSDPIETFAHRGDSRTDRPRIDEILASLDHAATLDADESPRLSSANQKSEISDDASDGADATQGIDRIAPRSESEPVVDDTDPTAGAATTEPATEPGESTAEGADSVSTREDSTATGEDALSTNQGTEVLSRERKRAPKPQRPLETPESVDLPEEIELRRGGNDDVVDAMRVLQGALLDVDGSTVRDAAPEGEVLLAGDGGWVIGALVMREGHIEGVAVRREYRGRGIGAALVEAAVADEGGTVTADFRAGVRGFWKSVGFDVEQEGSRFWGRRTVD